MERTIIFSAVKHITFLGFQTLFLRRKSKDRDGEEVRKTTGPHDLWMEAEMELRDWMFFFAAMRTNAAQRESAAWRAR